MSNSATPRVVVRLTPKEQRLVVAAYINLVHIRNGRMNFVPVGRHNMELFREAMVSNLPRDRMPSTLKKAHTPRIFTWFQSTYESLLQEKESEWHLADSLRQQAETERKEAKAKAAEVPPAVATTKVDQLIAEVRELRAMVRALTDVQNTLVLALRSCADASAVSQVAPKKAMVVYDQHLPAMRVIVVGLLADQQAELQALYKQQIEFRFYSAGRIGDLKHAPPRADWVYAMINFSNKMDCSVLKKLYASRFMPVPGSLTTLKNQINIALAAHYKGEVK